MVSYTLVEKFAKSPVKITIGVIFVIIALVFEITRLNGKLDKSDGKFDTQAKEYRDDIHRVENQLSDCQLDAKISRDNQIKAAIKDKNEYRDLWIKTKKIQLAIESKKN